MTKFYMLPNRFHNDTSFGKHIQEFCRDVLRVQRNVGDNWEPLTENVAPLPRCGRGFLFIYLYPGLLFSASPSKSDSEQVQQVDIFTACAHRMTRSTVPHSQEAKAKRETLQHMANKQIEIRTCILNFQETAKK